MKLVFKYKTEIFVLAILIILYFALRLPNLTLQPIFADEAIYIRWAQVMKSEPTLRFVSLSDGKTPFFMWMMVPMFKIFDDPLFAGRFLSVIAGLGTLLGVFFLTRKVFGKQAGYWSSLIYVVTPYTVFFDRMALVDSMLAAFTIWSVYFAIWLLQSQRLDLAMILGYFLGGGLLVKTPGMFNLLVLPVSILGFKFQKSSGSLVKLLVFWSISLIIGLAIYNILRLGPGFEQLSARNQDYVFSPSELVGRPLDPFIPHLRDLADWYPKLLTWSGLTFIFIGLFKSLVSKNRLGWVVVAWALVPLMIQLAFLKTFTARYLLSSIPLLITIGGFGFVYLSQKLKLSSLFSIALGLILILTQSLYFDLTLISDPAKAPLPRAERRGYLEDWTAGYGLKDIAQFLDEKSKEDKVVVGTEGFFGTLPDGLYIYLDKSEVVVIGGKSAISEQIRQTAKDNLTYFVGNKKRIEGNLKDVELVREYLKAKPLDNSPQDAIQLYKVNP
ncbi:glycosyltransferase family 39 protein [Candidatus Daviesbacteria bacterium]|nr:glycosyltransferase family 39 protein [Candidatus Daviesbacteria bacterium]